ELPLSLLGTFVLGMYVPWGVLLKDTIPGGGDNPAHPTLMWMIDDALFSHLHLTHYAYGFWGGFEAFQFYFPLPYVCGAALSHVPAFGKILQARREEEFSVGAVVLSVLAALSHFYALLMLLVLFVAFALQDGVHFIASRRLPWRAIGVYAIGIVSVLLMCWWI